MIWLEGQMWLEHRIIWKIVTGKEPPKVIDHKNRNPRDNRIENLRAANHSNNQLNSIACWSIHGAKGIKFTKCNKWEARIKKGKKYFHLGTYGTKEEALSARKTAEKTFYGEFAL